MKIVLFSEKENPFMKRRELVVIVEHPVAPTPTNAVLQQTLAKEWGVKPEQVDIKYIYSHTGRQSSRVRVFVWQEPKVSDLSKAAKAEEAKKEGGEEAKPAEAPAEEPKKEAAEKKPTEPAKAEKPAEAEAKPKEAEKPAEAAKAAPPAAA